jgi:hypothetical protein
VATSEPPVDGRIPGGDPIRRELRQQGRPTAATARIRSLDHGGQDRLVRLEPQTPHVFATGSDHYVQLRDPDLTTSVIRLIFGRVRALARRHHA